MSEFVLSNELVSMALAMVAENPEVNDILSELFTPDGNELYVHPASRYLRCAFVPIPPCPQASHTRSKQGSHVLALSHAEGALPRGAQVDALGTMSSDVCPYSLPLMPCHL